MEMLDPKDHKTFMEMAWNEAKRARCQKSHFGAVIVKDNVVLARGHNEPVGESCKICLRKEKNVGAGICSELCFAIHAEQNALLQALRERRDIHGAVMYIGHIKNGKIKKFLGKPFCTICTRLIAVSGLSGVILYAEDGYMFLSVDEFNEKAIRTILEKHGLQIDEKLIKAGSNLQHNNLLKIRK